MTKTVNLKLNNNSFEYAIHLLDTEIYDAKKLGINVLIIIHGYGSHGNGGVMKYEIQEHLLNLKRHKKIKNYVPGDKWTHQSAVVNQMISKYPDLIVNNQITGLNPGVTVVWVS